MTHPLRVPISFEFFPPNTPVGDEKLKTVVAELGSLQPEFFSVTYGAGGSTRDKTLATVRAIAASGFQAAPHLSCVGSTRAGIAQILDTYRAQKIGRLVALRGDLPSGTATVGEFRYASELIRFIREAQGSDWHIEVACYPEVHPQQRYAKRDLQFFADKVKAGATSAITQFFYNGDAYFHFVDEARKAGVTVPIVPGIMPILNYARIAQFAARDGIEIPRWVALKMEGFMDDTESIRAFGLDVVTNLCRRLIDGGAPGIHFYTLNQSPLSLEICRRSRCRCPAAGGSQLAMSVARQGVNHAARGAWGPATRAGSIRVALRGSGACCLRKQPVLQRTHSGACARSGIGDDEVGLGGLPGVAERRHELPLSQQRRRSADGARAPRPAPPPRPRRPRCTTRKSASIAAPVRARHWPAATTSTPAACRCRACPSTCSKVW